MTGRRTSSVKTLTESSGDGEGVGEACGFAGCCAVCAAPTAKNAAIKSSPVVRLRQNIYRDSAVWMPLGILSCLSLFHAKAQSLRKGAKKNLHFLAGLRLHRCDGNRVHDVVRGAAA